MDQIKIGKFIIQCRKSKKMTQNELVEKLNITDWAISKWENGNEMPDSSIMLELCDELEINVNELLNGEKSKNRNLEKESSNTILELLNDNEIKNKNLKLMQIIMNTKIAIINLSHHIKKYFGNAFRNKKIFKIS